MLPAIKSDLGRRLQQTIAAVFSVDHEPVIEVPPRRELGDLAAPAALHLARAVKRPPREIAATLAERLALPEQVLRVQVEGPGYLNFFLDRGAVARQLLDAPLVPPPARTRPKIIVEHTNINPNKAAHIGHLRNAVLGDVLVQCLRALGHPTEVQNYIDDTGVQLADVVVGFIDLRGASLSEVASLGEPFDFLCWDLYSEVGGWYEGDAERLALRRQTLHALEAGSGERADMGRLVARRVLARHLATMRRLGIEYDLLTRESEVLRLQFFHAAFEQLRERGAVTLADSGKNRGCWVMPLADNEEFKGLEDPDKVIVRSDGTVTYVGKDIAYQLWKFGLLGRDFEYRRWPGEGELWETAAADDSGAPARTFGGAHRVINVIDARQSYLQRIVRAGVRALGYDDEAERSIHFAYEMVALSPATAKLLGFIGDEDAAKSLEMSGRRGIGVKADDLLDQLEAKSREEIAARNRELGAAELDHLARQIAIAALRFFMVKATTTRIIAFDLDEALAFEGETGPYLQYSLVRVQNILRKLEAAGLATTVSAAALAEVEPELFEDDLWDLLLGVAQGGELVARAAETLELSLLARFAVDLAQKFHAIYHRHPILHAPDPARRAVRLAAARVFQRALTELCSLLGLPVPEKM